MVKRGMVVIAPYNPSWGVEFGIFGKALRSALGGVALGIHHIGSTSVPGMAAKDVIDIQLTVKDLNAEIRTLLERLGYHFREDIDRDHCPPGMELPPEELQKRYYQLQERRCHLHVRAAGRFNQRYALLFRDYLRATPTAANAYAEVKRQLARYFSENIEAYYDIKDPVTDAIIAGALHWSETVSWTEPPNDA